MRPRFPGAIRCLLAVHRPPDLHITLHAAAPHHHRLLHHSGLPAVAPQRHRGHHNSSARRPEKKAQADVGDVAPGGRGFCRLLVPTQLLRGVAVQPGHPLIQRPLLLLSLAGYELHLLQPFHLLLPESHLSPGAEAPLRHVQEETEGRGRVGTRDSSRGSLRSWSPGRLARQP